MEERVWHPGDGPLPEITDEDLSREERVPPEEQTLLEPPEMETTGPSEITMTGSLSLPRMGVRND
jgi:hypothetical protein